MSLIKTMVLYQISPSTRGCSTAIRDETLNRSSGTSVPGKIPSGPCPAESNFRIG